MPGGHFNDEEEAEGHLSCCRLSDDKSSCLSADSGDRGDTFDEDGCGFEEIGVKDAHHTESVVAGVWSHLPEDLLYAILTWLPSRSILRFRYVCKRWNHLFASPRFHHFASHQTLVPAWLFLSGRSNSSRADHEVCLRRGYDSRNGDHAITFVRRADAWHANRDTDHEDMFEKEHNFDNSDVNRDDDSQDNHDDDYVVRYDSIYSRDDDDDECCTYARDGCCANGDWDGSSKHSPSQLSFANASQEVSKGIVDGLRGYTHGFGFDHMQGAADVDNNSQVGGYGSGGAGEGQSFQLSSRGRGNAFNGFDAKDFSISNHIHRHDIGNDDLASCYISGKDRDCYVRGGDEHGICNPDGDVGGRQEAAENVAINNHSHCYGHSYEEKDEDLLLIFDCESATWLSPLAMPAGVKGLLLDDHRIQSIVCFSRDRLLIPAGLRSHICVENPAALSCQELPSSVSIQGTPHALGLTAERSTLYNMSNLQMSMHFSRSMDFPLVPLQNLHSNSFIQDHTVNDFKVIAVGETCYGTLVLEIFSSSMGTWHVGAIFPSNFIFYQTKLLKCDSKETYQARIVECNGFFFALLG